MSDSARPYNVIVIGAGHNGLTAAAILAKSHGRVLVLERRAVTGGAAAGEEFHPGYRAGGVLHDTASVHPRVIETLRLARYGVTTSQPPPVLAPARNGPGLLLHAGIDMAAREIGELSPRDAVRYRAYRAFFDRIAPLVARVTTQPPPYVPGQGAASPATLIGSALAARRVGRCELVELLRITPMCVADYLGEWFETELLRCVLAAPALDATFCGPWSPGTVANLIRLEAGPRRAVRGGAAALIDALATVARKRGVEIRTETPVAGIRIDDDDVVRGVRLEDGTEIDAPIVAASCDPKHTFLDLVEGRRLPARLEQGIVQHRMRGTTAQVNLALDGPLRFAGRPDLEIERARIAETIDDMERAFDAVKYGRVCDRPILDVHVPSVSDPLCAPEGGSVVSILVHFAPYAAAEGGWSDAARDALGDRVVGLLAEYAPGVRSAILAREVLTPVDIERRFGLTGGHPHHGEHALDQLLVRPCPECARYATPIRGLYLCGSGVHPGGGLTGLPGYLGARAIG